MDICKYHGVGLTATKLSSVTATQYKTTLLHTGLSMSLHVNLGEASRKAKLRALPRVVQRCWLLVFVCWSEAVPMGPCGGPCSILVGSVLEGSGDLVSRL